MGFKQDIINRLDKIQEFEWTKPALEEILEIRGRNNPLPVEILQEQRAFYVFNDEFCREYLGEDICRKFQLYSQDRCIYYKRLLIPIYDVMGKVIAFNAYTNDEGLPKYQLSSKDIWDRNKYFLANTWDYEEGLKRGYINLVDGTMDKFRLNSINEPCFGGFGTSLSKEQKSILKLYKNIIVSKDNDKAGNELVRMAKQINGVKVFSLTREVFKDVDDFLGDLKDNEKVLKHEINTLRKSEFMLNRIIRRKDYDNNDTHFLGSFSNSRISVR